MTSRHSSNRTGGGGGGRAGYEDRYDEAQNEDDEWLFESIVAFLSSPIWTAPIQQFFENNCSIFSSDESWSGGAIMDDDDDDDMSNVPTEFIQVHVKYKDLVDVLIKSFLEDLGISYSKFVRACKNSNRLRDHPVYIELFEQVWCADNYKLFKAQMMRKNVELELQALILLQYQLGLIKPESKEAANDDEIMAIIMKKSKDEYDLLMNSSRHQRQPAATAAAAASVGGSSNVDLPIKKPKDLETAKQLVKSEQLVENLKQELDQQDYLNRKIVEDELKNKHNTGTGSSTARLDRPMSAKKITTPRDDNVSSRMQNMRLDDRNLNNSGGRHKNERKNIHEDEDDDDIMTYEKGPVHKSTSSSSRPPVNDLTHSILAQTSDNLNDNELQKRAEFMRKQRDLLNEKKRVERQKQLDQFTREAERGGAPKRPMSSRAARSVLSGADPVELQQQQQPRSDEERKRLEARRALAETLKREVVNNSKK